MGASLSRARRKELVEQAAVYRAWLLGGGIVRVEFQHPLKDGTFLTLFRECQQSPNGARVLAARQRLAFATGVFSERLGGDSCLL